MLVPGSLSPFDLVQDPSLLDGDTQHQGGLSCLSQPHLGNPLQTAGGLSPTPFCIL